MGMLYKRGAVWSIKYYRNGRGLRESSRSTKEGDRRLLKLREGDVEHGLPVDPKLNRIRFDEAAEDLKTEYAVNGITSEVLPLEWRQVEFKAGEVRLDAGTTKNREGRVFPMTAGLRELLKAQQTEHERLKKAGHIVPFVFFREVAERRGGDKKPQPIVSFNKAWKNACRAAGYPGRIPHDLRRTAVRSLVHAGIPERVAMMMTGHKTRSVFERYNIVSETDLREAARKLDGLSGHGQAAKVRG